MKTTYHIESYLKGRLIDISEFPFQSEDDAKKEIENLIKSDREINAKVKAEIAEEGISELFNEDSDRMPVFFTPVIYTYKIGEYAQTEQGLFTPEEYLSMVF